MKCSSSKNLLKKIGFLNAGSLTVFLFLAMLVSPDIVFTGAADGLLLWFNTIFPTLFPFMFITAILLKSGGLNIIANVLGKPLGKIFSVSAAGAFSGEPQKRVERQLHQHPARHAQQLYHRSRDGHPVHLFFRADRLRPACLPV